MYLSDTDCRSLLTEFGRLFSEKVERIRNSIDASLRLATRFNFTPRQHAGPALTVFSPMPVDEFHEVPKTMRIKSSDLDLLPSPLLRQSIGVFAPVLARMANILFESFLQRLRRPRFYHCLRSRA